MNQDKLKILEILYENSQEFRDFTAELIKKQTAKAEEQANKLKQAASLFTNDTSSDELKEEKSTSGSRNHRKAIRKVLKANPSIQVRELRELLKKENHPIERRTLNTILGVMRDENELKTSGDRGSYEWSVKNETL